MVSAVTDAQDAQLVTVRKANSGEAFERNVEECGRRKNEAEQNRDDPPEAHLQLTFARWASFIACREDAVFFSGLQQEPAALCGVTEM